LDTTDPFLWLQNWYADHCNGDWEHGSGIQIGTIDNPGWRVKINLYETELSEGTMERIVVDRGGNDWLNCWVESWAFNAACGVVNINEVLSIFRVWAETGNAKVSQ
jgi:hypothetical protein